MHIMLCIALMTHDFPHNIFNSFPTECVNSIYSNRSNIFVNKKILCDTMDVVLNAFLFSTLVNSPRLRSSINNTCT